MTSSTSIQPSSPDRSVALAASSYLFQRIRAQLGQKFVDMFAADMKAALEEWAIGLRGFRQHELDRGLAECSDRKFAPTLGEFKQFCRPALDPEYAWHEAARGLRARDEGEVGRWSHPAVYRAAVTLSYEIRRNTFAGARKRWEMELHDEFEKGWGGEVPPPAPRVEYERTGIPMPPELRQRMASLGIHLKRGMALPRAIVK